MSSKAELIALLNSKVLTGGRRTKAVGVREMITELIAKVFSIGTYDPEENYVAGDSAIYNNGLYYCTTPTSGAFDITKWSLILGGKFTQAVSFDADGNPLSVLGSSSITLGASSEVPVQSEVSIAPNVIDIEVTNAMNGTIGKVEVDSESAALKAFDDSLNETSIKVTDEGVEIKTKNENTVTIVNENASIPRKQYLADENGTFVMSQDGKIIGKDIVVQSPNGSWWKLSPNNDGEALFEPYIP